jgi:meiotically up-regulated gene 157 (Mug157) protein
MEKSNRDMIMDAIAFLDEDNDEFVTISWLKEHQAFFCKIRKEFPDLSETNIDIRDKDFRSKANTAEKYATILERKFDVYTYCLLCKICYEMYQFCEQESDLTEAFSKMNVATK